MKYVRIDRILPDDLVKEIQKYIHGEYVYIPTPTEKRKRWGEKSKIRDYLKARNAKILNQYIGGQSISSLAEEFFLSDSSIKKIVYKKDK
nr:CD3324 family protein [Inediibacterium massiliense]